MYAQRSIIQPREGNPAICNSIVQSEMSETEKESWHLIPLLFEESKEKNSQEL